MIVCRDTVIISFSNMFPSLLFEKCQLSLDIIIVSKNTWKRLGKLTSEELSDLLYDAMMDRCEDLSTTEHMHHLERCFKGNK